jgi:hypothetical protein
MKNSQFLNSRTQLAYFFFILSFASSLRTAFSLGSSTGVSGAISYVILPGTADLDFSGSISSSSSSTERFSKIFLSIQAIVLFSYGGLK